MTVEQDFDRYSSRYKQLLDESITVSGETGQYFAELKVRYLARRLGPRFSGKLLDYGCGVGLLSCYLKEYFPQAELHGFDLSKSSIESIDHELALQAKFVSDVRELAWDYDLIVVANVLHHVSVPDRQKLVQQLTDRLRSSGALVVFEHNPVNPLTRWAVGHCAFDVGVTLLWPREVRGYFESARLQIVKRDYIAFFPRWLASLRPVEPHLRWLPVGAQYAFVGRRS